MKRLITLLLALACAVPATAAAAPPLNDNFLSPVAINQPATTLAQVSHLQPDLTEATVQPNLLAPCAAEPCAAGPPENTACKNSRFGQTTWYRFYPPRDGIVGLQFADTKSFPMVTFYALDANDLPIDPVCRFAGTWSAWANVQGGQGYAMQIGALDPGQDPYDAPRGYQYAIDMYFLGRARRTTPDFKVRYVGRPLKGDAFSVSRLELKGVPRGAHINLQCFTCGGKFRAPVRRGALTQLRAAGHVKIVSRSVVQIAVRDDGKNGRYRLYWLKPGSHNLQLKEHGCMPPHMNYPTGTFQEARYSC